MIFSFSTFCDFVFVTFSIFSFLGPFGFQFWTLGAPMWHLRLRFVVHLGSPLVPFSSLLAPVGTLLVFFGSSWFPFGSIWHTFGSLWISFARWLRTAAEFHTATLPYEPLTNYDKRFLYCVSIYYLPIHTYIGSSPKPRILIWALADSFDLLQDSSL